MIAALPVLAGALAGTGLTVGLAALRPAPPRIDAALARLAEPAPAAGALTADAWLGRWLAARLIRPGGIAVPRADLALLSRSPETYLLHKLVAAVAGLVSFAFVGAVCAVAGIPLPWEAPAVASIGAAAGLWFLTGLDVRAEAARRRRDFTFAWISFLQLVRLARAAGAGTSEALKSSAQIGEGWPYALISSAISQAADAHTPLWEGLAELGERIGADEVTELASTLRIAGSEGTKIAETLTAKTVSLRGQLHAETRSRANSRTTTMIVPLTLLGLGFVLLLAYPSFYTLLQT